MKSIASPRHSNATPPPTTAGLPQHARRGPPQGNAAAASERQGGGTTTGPFSEPWLNDALSACFGQSLGGLSAAFGVDPGAPGAQATTQGTAMRFGDTRAPDADNLDAMAVVAHEVAHALGTSTEEDLFDTPHDPGEAQAHRAGEGFRRWVEAGLTGPAPRLQPAHGGRAQIHRDSTVAALTGSPALRLGSRGDAVRALQSALGRAGHPLSIDGSFGAQTRAAVVAFQARQGLPADGVVGPQTAAALNRTSSSSPATTPAPAPATTDALTGTGPLRQGDRGEGVRALQAILNTLGSRLTVDGVFGALTHAAVVAIQRALGLTVDGIVGDQTRAALQSPTPTPTPSPTPSPEVEGGSQGESVAPAEATPPEEVTAPAPVSDTSGHVVTDAQAFLRTPPPNLVSTGEIIPSGTRVEIVEEASRNGHAYVRVEGRDGTAWGWTSKSNLSSGKEHDESMAPSDTLDLAGLSGSSLAMAQIYNTRGAYLQQEADTLGVEVVDTAAVLKAESGGRGFSLNGDMIIRFENHIFYDQWGRANPSTFGQHFKYSGNKRWEGHYFRDDAAGSWETFHGNQAREWEVLSFARGLDDTAALKSISMGAAQIMGFNHAGQGFTTVQEMFEEMNSGIRPQLEGMFTFIANNNTCMTGLRTGDYEMFARGYNGSGQAAHYGGLIEGYARALRRVLEAQDRA